jgi:hypothetical protein
MFESASLVDVGSIRLPSLGVGLNLCADNGKSFHNILSSEQVQREVGASILNTETENRSNQYDRF